MAAEKELSSRKKPGIAQECEKTGGGRSFGKDWGPAKRGEENGSPLGKDMCAE